MMQGLSKTENKTWIHFYHVIVYTKCETNINSHIVMYPKIKWVFTRKLIVTVLVTLSDRDRDTWI